MTMNTDQALDVLNQKLVSLMGSVPICFGNEDNILPDTPAAFLYVDSFIWDNRIAEYGGGFRRNRYRNRGSYDVYCFIPKGEGISPALAYAQQVRNEFTSFRYDDLTVEYVLTTPGGDGSSLKPVGLSSEIDNYYFAVAEISFYYDELG